MLQIFIKSRSSGLAIQKRQRGILMLTATCVQDAVVATMCIEGRRSKILDFRSSRASRHRPPPFLFLQRGELRNSHSKNRQRARQTPSSPSKLDFDHHHIISHRPPPFCFFKRGESGERDNRIVPNNIVAVYCITALQKRANHIHIETCMIVGVRPELLARESIKDPC